MSEKKEYIEREALIDELDKRPERYYFTVINEAPAADVEPVVRGEWRNAGGSGNWVCTNCHDLYYTNKYKRCPSCGAHMKRSGSGE